jgi:ABC-type transport system involved in multi-copper enzyme maturation permease subunit
VAFVGGWVEQIGTIADSPTARDIGIASSLFMPSEALWRYAASLLQGSGLLGSITPFSTTSQPTPAFVVYSAIYVIVMLGAAMWAFSRRDF